jgi:hypothetical protein
MTSLVRGVDELNLLRKQPKPPLGIAAAPYFSSPAKPDAQ